MNKQDQYKLEKKLQKEKDKNRELGHRMLDLHETNGMLQAENQELENDLDEATSIIVTTMQHNDEMIETNLRLVELLLQYLDRDAAVALQS